MVKKIIKQWIDGDSGIFTDDKRFRLSNVRAPEKGKQGGTTATRVAAGITGRSNGRVNVKQVATDKYGRAVVEMDNKDGSVNGRLRKKGYTNKGR